MNFRLGCDAPKHVSCNLENCLWMHNIICFSYTACDQDIQLVLWITVLDAQNLLVPTKTNPIELLKSVSYPKKQVKLIHCKSTIRFVTTRKILKLNISFF